MTVSPGDKNDWIWIGGRWDAMWMRDAKGKRGGEDKGDAESGGKDENIIFNHHGGSTCSFFTSDI